MSSRAKREKYRYVGSNASSAAVANAAPRPISRRNPKQSGIIAVPISAGASRAVKSESPNSTYIAAVR
jgi:hypothetical protein